MAAFRRVSGQRSVRERRDCAAECTCFERGAPSRVGGPIPLSPKLSTIQVGASGGRPDGSWPSRQSDRCIPRSATQAPAGVGVSLAASASACWMSCTARRWGVRPRADSAVAAAAFRARLAELGAELLEPAWLGVDTPQRVRCAAGHECAPRPASVRRGGGICRTCAGNDPRVAEAAFRARLAELGAELLEPYRGSLSPHRVRCAAGHECTPRPAEVQRGRGICRTCAGNDPAVAEAAFRARLAELGAELLEPYRGNHSPVRVRCAAGHECTPQPANVQQGRGICRTCAGKDPAAAETAFRARLAELGAELLEPAWLGGNVPHRVRCAAGHESATRPSHVLAGRGACRFCAGKVWDVFYVVAAPDRLKFGIASRGGKPRLATHRAAGFHAVVRLMTDLPGETAPDIERAVLAALHLAGVGPVRGREYYDIDALALVLDVVDNYPVQAVVGVPG